MLVVTHECTCQLFVHVPFFGGETLLRTGELETSGDFLLIFASWAESSRVECIPVMPALAGPGSLCVASTCIGATDAGKDRAECLVEFDGIAHPPFRAVLDG
jgi:hypothetical protein